jgi:hypothetical protein
MLSGMGERSETVPLGATGIWALLYPLGFAAAEAGTILALFGTAEAVPF